MTTKEIEIIFNDGDVDFRYSSIDILNGHSVCLTNKEMLDTNDPEFADRIVHYIKPLPYNPQWQRIRYNREFSTDGRGMIIQTIVNDKVKLEEREEDYIKRHTPRPIPKDHQLHGYGYGRV